VSVTIQEQKPQHQRRERKKKYRIKARIEHRDCIVETEDYGSFTEMYKKYGQREFIYFCADVKDETGQFSYRLDSDEDTGHTLNSLENYGRHKAWIQPRLRINGKRVILVKDAAGLLGVAVVSTAVHIYDEPEHRRLHRRGIEHKHLDNNLKHRPGEHGTATWRTRRDGRRYRR
jgi:hypothetical protein